MNALQTSLLSLFLVGITTTSFAQEKTEKISVNGECGMCKSTIEKAAKNAGASYALWNVDAKVLTVKYDGKTTSTNKIEKAVAAAGYDTEHAKAPTEAYDKLHGCCKYERQPAATEGAKKDSASSKS